MTLINRGQIKATDFVISEGGAVLLKDEASHIVLTAYQNRKKRGNYSFANRAENAAWHCSFCAGTYSGTGHAEQAGTLYSLSGEVK